MLRTRKNIKKTKKGQKKRTESDWTRISKDSEKNLRSNKGKRAPTSFHYKHYSQTCVQRSPLGNGKVTVIYRVTAIYRSTLQKNIRQLKFWEVVR